MRINYHGEDTAPRTGGQDEVAWARQGMSADKMAMPRNPGSSYHFNCNLIRPILLSSSCRRDKAGNIAPVCTLSSHPILSTSHINPPSLTVASALCNVPTYLYSLLFFDFKSLAVRIPSWCLPMDVSSGLQQLAVFVVGWSMALGGFLLSVSASLIISLVPLLRPRVPDEVHDDMRRRVHSYPHDEEREHDASDTCSANSLQSFNTAASEPSTSRQAPSTPPTSLGNSPESPSQALPPASPIPHGKSGQTCTSKIAQHVCTPEKCANTASTSAVASSSFPPVAQEIAEKFMKSRIGESDVTKMKGTRAIRAVSWLKRSSSPASSESQRSPRSSAECSRIPSNASSHRVVTFEEDRLGSSPKKREPRRANTLLSFRRFSRAPARSDSEDTSSSSFAALSMTQMPSQVPEGRSSAPASPIPALHELPELSRDTEIANRERKRHVSYFARLKRRTSGKRTEKAHKAHEGAVLEMKDSEKLLSESHHQSNSMDRGRSREKRSSMRICEKRRRPATAPTAPPARTNPYEAPYFFPTPLSPNAANYVRLARTEVHRTSVSPSAAERTPLRSNLTPYHPTAETLTLTPTPTRSNSMQQKRSGAIIALSPNEQVPQSAPPKRTSFPVAVLDRHRKSASVSEASPTEFGVLQHMSPIDSQGKCETARHQS
ncbi:hypothetical protein A7U60_g5799 [Sanghuangporus baumii]|uniref:Uncharacterized protein n=1 Tax=Sanghuangporus baumii TaxID=108892 RepID=A0A9Q5NB42_SANBA|nr:hypothetical protein A7U60_g5799 [Sanghuangporus baumii]